MTEYSNKINISNKMAKAILNSQNYLWSWYEGSAQSGKSVTAALAMALMIEAAPAENELFLAIGYTTSSAKNNVGRCGGFGVQAYFGSLCEEGKYLDNDCLKIKTANGLKYLVFFGGSTVSSNNAWHGWKVSGFVLDEIDRLHKNTIDEAKLRITTIENAHIIATQNPTNPKAEIYKELEWLESSGQCNYVHWTLDDNVGMSAEQIAKVKERYDPTSIFYKRFVLGQRCVAEALIYNINDNINIFNEIDASEYISSIIVIDSGDTVSATAIQVVGLRRGFKGLDVLFEYHHRNADNSSLIVRQTLDDDCQKLVDMIFETREKLGRFPREILFDGSEAVEYAITQVLANADVVQIPLSRARKKLKQVKESEHNGWIIDRIRYASGLLFKGRLRFHKDCKHTIEAFKSAQYNPKKLEQGVEERLDEPQNGTMCDELDCTDYAIIYYKDDLERVNG